jgi:hypothetical protein
MRRMIVVALAVMCMGAVFFLAPIVYSPYHQTGGCASCAGTHPDYESPSCAVFSVGVATVGWVGGNYVGTYHIGCAPSIVSLK